MTDTQMITIMIAVLAVLAGTLFNNVRIGDMNNRFTDTNSRIADTKELLRAEFRKEFAEHNLQFNKRFDSIDRKLDEILRIVGDHETRITRLEPRPR